MVYVEPLKGKYAFCAYLRIQWEHYHREGTTPVIYLFVFCFRADLLLPVMSNLRRGGFPLTHSMVSDSWRGLWIAMMARSRATARTDTAISKPCVCSYLLLAESGRP